MHVFATNSGQQWEVCIDVAAVKRVRALLSLDLYGLVDNGATGLNELLSDPVRFVDTIYVLCRVQADRLGVSDEAFGQSLGGDSLAAAADAFLEELIDFFPDSKARANLRRLMVKGREVADRVAAAAERTIAEFDPETVARTLIASSGNAPGISASTPPPSPSATS